MSEKIRTKYKKLAFSILMAACPFAVVMPSYVNATTINTASTASSAMSVNVKDTTITFDGVTDDTEGPIMNATIERAAGIPDGATRIALKGEGTVTVNGQVYRIYFSHADLKKTSNTQAKVQFYLAATTGEGDALKSVRQFTSAQIKGNAMNIKIDEVKYIKTLTTLSEEFTAQLKNVAVIQGVTAKEAGIGWIGNKGNIIPKKGLNIPMFKEDQTITLDNIGFISGKLALRINTPNNSFYNVIISDSTGESICGTGYGLGEGSGMIETYDKVKDAAALSKCTVQADGSIVIACDQETKSITCTF